MANENEVMAEMKPARDIDVFEQTINTVVRGEEESEPNQPEFPVSELTPPTPSIPSDFPVKPEGDQDGSVDTITDQEVVLIEGSSINSQVAFMVDYVNYIGILFHSPDLRPFASVRMNGHIENFRIHSKNSKQLIKRAYYKRTGKPPKAPAVKIALDILEAQAVFDGPEIPLHIRNARYESSIYIDLCNSSYEQVRITKYGWTVIASKDSPIKFIRIQGMKAIPVPIRNGSIDPLKKCLNIDSEGDWVMIITWLLGSMNPLGPFPVLVFQGAQGTAKSTIAKILRSVIDPSTVPSQSMPGSERDLVIAANNSWAQNFDNLSSQKPAMSDAVCRLATGGGFRTRTLYTDDYEHLFNSTRPIIMNGIADIVTRHDLADRSIFINLPAISEKKRKPEFELLREIYDQLPSFLGVLYDAVSMALRNYDTVKVPNLPRMADFAKWVIAAEPALPWKQGKFMKEYNENRRKVIEAAIESDAVACAVIRLINDSKTAKQWSGTPTELKNALDLYAPGQGRASADWPKAVNALSNRLMRIQGFLKTKGIEIERGKSGNRIITISMSDQSVIHAGQDSARQIDKKDDKASSDDRLRENIAAGAKIASQQLGLEDKCADSITATDLEYEEGEI